MFTRGQFNGHDMYKKAAEIHSTNIIKIVKCAVSSMFAVTTVIIMSYMSYKSHAQYFYNIVCIDKKHNRKGMMEI